MTEALNALGINTGLLLANIINLVLMIALLSAVAYKPIVNMMRERRERIAQGVNDARKAEEALASAEADKQAILDEARAEAQRITAEARQRAEEAADKIRSDAREEAQRIREDSTQEAEQEKDLVLADMREQIISLSMAAANRIIKVGVSEKEQKQAVTEFFTDVPDEARDLPEPLEVVTAVPLTDSEQSNVKKALGADDVTFTTDTRILGGVIVRGGGQQVDGSYANQLREMRAQLA